MALQIGDTLDGKYRILERLGAGGMGEVYKVEHVYLRAIRVVKVIRTQISESADAHERFLREAQLATKVQHPNVATLHDFSALPDGSHYMVWEYIEGENLAQLIRRRGVLPPPEAIRLAVQTLAGLDAIHRAGIIHRDMSPENLMITPDGNVKIIDLGVAKAEAGDYAATQTGMFVGKLRYSSPEQLGFLTQGEKIDSRADLYSFGVVLFEMLAGRPPFEATSPHQYFVQHAGGTNVQPVDLTLLPQEMRPVMARALESDRNRRFANAREFANALEHVPQPSTATTIRTAVPTEIIAMSKPAGSHDLQNAIIIIGVVLILAIGVAATWFYRARGGPSTPAVAVTTRAPQPQPPQAQPTTATVDVNPQPVVAPPPATVSSEQQTASSQPATATEPPARRSPPAVREKPAPAPAPVPQEESTPETGNTFIEGGDSSGNEAAIAFAQQHVRGVNRVAVETTNPRLVQVVRSLGLTVTDEARVMIRFEGDVTRMRFGRKRREGRGSITKNGRTIFRYEMKPEDYRVGDTPVEAFARVLSDIFGH